MDAMLTARAALWKEWTRLHDLVLKTVAQSKLSRCFMASGRRAVTALSFMTAIDDPVRFRRSRSRRLFRADLSTMRSGTSIDARGRISKVGDAYVRRTLYKTASSPMTHLKGNGTVQSCGQRVAKRSCHHKAVARRSWR
ncbi:MAG: transposase [Chitinophagales bacterium]|nr:transposase [Hyphomicrobiales bacterium]